MIETKRILRVPHDKKIRELLRNEVAAFVSENHIQPPADMATLENQAKKILSKTDQNTKYLNFTIVLLGNEVWREVVAATPFHRRLLLLPQCLRNNIHCQGVFDQLGLVCGGCKNCRLDDILEKAEKLGYATLVAEGTTVAIGLVEEGSIDAVIGVSCMPVLQNSFGPVTRAAVPAIGLPLLFDGCENTSLDYDWLFSEMEQLTENPAKQPLSVSLLKNQVAEYFSEKSLKRWFPKETVTEKLALKTMILGGQRMRPILSALAYQSFAEKVDAEIQAMLAVVIECFHKASLIHDDIEDDEEFRYGQPTLYKSEGVATAINVGDYLIGKGYHLLAQIPCDAAVKAECLKIVSSSHLNLSEGQGSDILFNQNIREKSVNDVIKIFEQKTGEAVKVALLTGAIAGRASEDEIQRLIRFSENFGIAYQIRDDLNEFREENELKHAFDFPFLLALLNRDLNGELNSFPELIKTENYKLLHETFRKYKTEEHAQKFLDDYIRRCYSELKNMQNTKLRLSLYGLVGKVFKS
ncbi:MAG: polyprenyl synthetase family protein [Prolixibacteraceae bacterium]